MHVFMPDRWHFHRRNFATLFDDLKAHGVPFTIGRARRDWLKRHGDYAPLADRLRADLARLEGLDIEALLTAEEAGVPLLAAAHDEFLCRVLPTPRWADGFGSNTVEAVARRAFADPADRRLLLLNAAAAADWARHWRALLTAHAEYTHVLAFSGAYIYTRTLLAVAAGLGRRCFVLETFFTGNEFYLEERNTPLPNASRLAHDAFPALGAAAPPPDPDAGDAARALAHARLAAMRNKNVRALDDGAPTRLFAPEAGEGPRVLIVGQVLNDFSLTGTPLSEGSALAFYRALIDALLARGCRVAFKAHPWERKRPNLGRPFTLEALERTHGAAGPRLRLIERAPIGQVFPQVDHVMGLCSQGLLEACQAGFKPVQFGRAFFGGLGFTHDADQQDAPAIAEAVAAHTMPGRLTLDEYRRFEDFLAAALTRHLLPSHDGRRGAVAARLGLAEPTAAPALPDPAEVSSGWWPGWQFTREALADPRPWLRDAAFWIGRCIARD